MDEDTIKYKSPSWQGLLPVREEAQEDTEGRDKDWRENQEQSRREAEDEEKARDEGGCAHLVVVVVYG